MRKDSAMSFKLAEVIGTQGIKCLLQPRYGKFVKTTEYQIMKNGLCAVEYLDENGDIICHLAGQREDFPPVGEVVEVPFVPTTFGDLIKDLREDMGATQEELSKYCNIPLQTWIDWESNISAPDYCDRDVILTKIDQYKYYVLKKSNGYLPNVSHVCKRCRHEFSGVPAAKYCIPCSLKNQMDNERDAAKAKNK